MIVSQPTHIRFIDTIFRLLLAFSPIFLGGNRSLPLLAIQLISIVLLFSLVGGRVFFKSAPPRFVWFAILLLALPAIQLIPIPFSLWHQINTFKFYGDTLLGMVSDPGDHFFSLTLIPFSTVNSLITLLGPMSIFAYVIAQPSERLASVVKFLVGIALTEALLGLAQFGTGPMSIMRFGPAIGSVSAAGTYANRDHFAGLMEMALCINLALIFGVMNRSISSWKKVVESSSAPAFLAYVSTFIVIALGLIFSQSRAGIALGILSTIAFTAIFSYRLRQSSQMSLIKFIFLIVLLSALSVGIVPILERFTQDPMSDLRYPMYVKSIEVIQHFFPWGSGVGTFSEVFERFKDVTLNGVFINHAHNDYLEWFIEGGLYAMALIALFIVLVCMQWRRILSIQSLRTYHFIKVGAGIGMCAMMLHSLVDFNLHIPANQIFFAVLVGLFFHEPREEAPVSSP